MAKITALRSREVKKKRVNVFLDGKFVFSLEGEVAAREGLAVGQELSSTQVETLARSDQFSRCLNAATRYLSYRPRSEFEMRQRLNQRGFDSGSIEAVMAKLKEQGLIDDVAFAQFWKDNRQSFSPRSQYLVKLELRRKGIADDIIAQVVDAVDDDDSAYQAALRKTRSLPPADYQSFQRRLGGYLKRRGFDYGIIDRTVGRMWRERENSSG